MAFLFPFFFFFYYGNFQIYTKVKSVTQCTPVVQSPSFSNSHILLSPQDPYPPNFCFSFREFSNGCQAWDFSSKYLSADLQSPFCHHHVITLIAPRKRPWTIPRPSLLERQGRKNRGQVRPGLKSQPCQCVSVDLLICHTSLTIQLFCERELMGGMSVSCLNEIMNVGVPVQGWAQYTGFPFLGPIYSFSRDAIRKYQKLGALFSHNSGD